MRRENKKRKSNGLERHGVIAEQPQAPFQVCGYGLQMSTVSSPGPFSSHTTKVGEEQILCGAGVLSSKREDRNGDVLKGVLMVVDHGI